ncbi:MAG TPA: helix-turn-helix transcriptional regulator [Bacillales bacterium]|nr:helix-turn-helix transcriptional regulator [Bacillales bacterium]
MTKKVDLKKIKQLRLKEELTLADIAYAIGYDSPNGYYYLERGRSQFTAEKLAEIADLFGVPIDELFVETHEKETEPR